MVYLMVIFLQPIWMVKVFPTNFTSLGLDSKLKYLADFLELALQFGMIMMFACAFPLAFAFTALVCLFGALPYFFKLIGLYRLLV